MNEYKCQACKGGQYSSADEKNNEPCVYCGSNEVKKVGSVNHAKEGDQ